MPYAAHPKVQTPAPDTLEAWRYLDMEKLRDLVESRTLFFASVALLGETHDPFEGRLSAPTVAEFRTIPHDVPPHEVARRHAVADHNLGLVHASRELVYVSCWHLSDHESVAMWREYAKAGKGIAIKTTIGRIKDAFASEPAAVHIGTVAYIDHLTDRTEWSNAFYRALYKPKAYDYERELRCIILTIGDSRGVRAAVDLRQLIEAVYLAPRSAPRDRQAVQALLAQYGLGDLVRESSLDMEPPGYTRPPA